MSEAYLLLEDGTRFGGDAAGASGVAVGEVVFNTSMSGYQEAVSDPSYRGQIIVFTYPHIGNYGVAAEHMESDAVHARAVVMREGVDRDDGTPGRGRLAHLARRPRRPGAVGRRYACAGAPYPGQGRDARRGVPGRAAGARGDGAGDGRALDGRPRPRSRGHPGRAADPRPATTPAPGSSGIDTGIKGSIVRNLRERGVRLELHPCTTTADELLAREPDAVFLANGPGDPAALDYVVENVRGVVGKVPVWGICLGHQLLCRAVGLETFKLPFGHRGANHPVKDLATGRIDITSQNHGFAVLGPNGARTIDTDEPVRWDTDFGIAELSQLNLYDRTVEGLVLHDVPASTVQYHPEAGPGPHDSLYLFDTLPGVPSPGDWGPGTGDSCLGATT